MLSKKGLIKKGSLGNFQPGSSLINKYTFLAQKPREANLEGFLFPDTYRLFLTTSKSVEPAVNKFLSNFDKHLNNDLRQTIEKKNWNLYEVLILASLIEKEVSSKGDKALVADILERRLKNNKYLQVDASVVYAKMRKNNISWKKALPLQPQDYKINSLYNTYRYKGLPPAPICNPGMDSILAVVFPQKNSYWYYLSNPQTGETIFSKSFRKHKESKFKYLR